jgi:hypothetical protein
MEQARRPALAHHVHWTAPMGPRVLINGIWYKPNNTGKDQRKAPGAKYAEGGKKQMRFRPSVPAKAGATGAR